MCAIGLLIVTPVFGRAPRESERNNSTARVVTSRGTEAPPSRGVTRSAERDTGAGERRVGATASRHRSDKQKARIDSLDVDLRHDGCFWIVEIEYEVELEGFASDDAFILGLELMRDDKPVTDDKGEPIVVVAELIDPKKDKKGEREYEGKLRIRVHKDWVQNDDDLDIKASLVHAADGRIFDTEEESADKDRPGPTLHIGVCGIGISIPL
ncbi:MAG TPA: hypothetical protein P5081_08300 [Phycisphaerae bacterium]|nr:hypothetical protein [Phycisphaerae bacterium]HRW52874.1 hypothetical protein [Phycisphaerae bacterium]